MWRDTAVDDDDIWNKYRDELTRYAGALVGRDEADDVLSTVVTRILRWRRLADLDDPRSYLYRAVLNESRSVGRNRSRLSVRPVDDQPTTPTFPDPTVLDAVLDSAHPSALGRLPVLLAGHAGG